MATVSILWHLHQPGYRTADGVAHAPWVAIHAGGAYTTLATAILDEGGRGQVVNIVPVLYEQLEAYADGRVTDPVLEAISTPATDLADEQRQTLVEWAFHVPGRQLERYPRLRALAARRPRDPAVFGAGDLRDLQVLLLLAQAGERAWRDPRLAPLASKGRHFNAGDHRDVTAWLSAQPGELLELWQRLAAADGVEISTSPYAHPIVPLLADTGVVRDSWAPADPPAVPSFRRPDDAAWQLDRGLGLMRARGFAPVGCWPPEGSVSAAAVEVYRNAGVRWLVTDEGILERSLDTPVRTGDGAIPELYRPWRLGGTDGPALFFRDRWLSDTIGFVYANWDSEERAANDLADRLETVARTLDESAAIVLALDGENAWLHYPEGGGTFLRTLMRRLNDAPPRLRASTLTEVVDGGAPLGELPRLHPGSWINAVFATWIGHPEKTAAWERLAAVRDALPSGERPESLLLAEGSDWFWWLGDDNPTELAPLYDRIFRRHLEDVCGQAGIESPVDLDEPLKTLTRPLKVPISLQWPSPTIDGRMTSYFEWSIAAWIEAEGLTPFRRIAVWGSSERLHLLVEGDDSMAHLVNGDRLTVRLRHPDGDDDTVTLGADGSDGVARAAIGRVAELSLPWQPRSGYRLEVRLGEHQIPEGAVMLLEPIPVDEELTAEE